MPSGERPRRRTERGRGRDPVESETPRPPDDGTALLLDTHVWIWIAAGEGSRLGPGVVERIEQAGRAGRVLIHPISIWEVGTLVRKGRLALAMPTTEWVHRALTLPGIFLLDMSPDCALDGALLPSEELTDPVDRILVAAARLERAALVTADRRILEFAEGGWARVLAAG
jgi:PIN domain nuclease of toxin-antitoxin system